MTDIEEMTYTVQFLLAHYDCILYNFHKPADNTLIERLTGRPYEEDAADARQVLHDACGGFFRAMGAPNAMDIWRPLGAPRAEEWRTLERGRIEELGPGECQPHRASTKHQKCRFREPTVHSWLALQAIGRGVHSRRAAEPPGAQWEATVRP